MTWLELKSMLEVIGMGVALVFCGALLLLIIFIRLWDWWDNFWGGGK